MHDPYEDPLLRPKQPIVPFPVKMAHEVTVHGVIETLQKVVSGASLTRFGDGEVKLMLFTPMKFQEPSKILQYKLLEALRANEPGLCVGVVHHSQLEMAKLAMVAPEAVVHRTEIYMQKINCMWDPRLEYWNAFVSRPDVVQMNDYSEFFSLWRQLWNGRNVVAVESLDGTITQPGVLDGAASVKRIPIPRKGAWNRYESIRKACLRQPEGTLFLLSAGPLATVLVRDLHIAGYQAVDVGHIWKWLRSEDPFPLYPPVKS